MSSIRVNSLLSDFKIRIILEDCVISVFGSNLSLKFIEYLINNKYSIPKNLFTRGLRVSLFHDSIKFWVIEPYPSNNIDFLQLQILTKNNYFLFPTQRKYLMVILKVYVLRQDILSLC